MTKIRITRGDGWYVEAVGAEFEVNEENFFMDEGQVYYVDPEDSPGGRRFVRAVDCEVVSEEVAEPDAVYHPSHYTAGKIEVIDIIKQTTAGYASEPFIAHCIGTATKYFNRAPYKHETPTEDIKKAKTYLEFAINHLEEFEKEKELSV